MAGMLLLLHVVYSNESSNLLSLMRTYHDLEEDVADMKNAVK